MVEPHYDISLAPFTQYNIGGTAREVYVPSSADELVEVFSRIRKSGLKYFLLGGGTNVLIGDGYWDGAVIITRDMTGHNTFDDHISCGAGLSSSKIAEIALEHGKTGLEFLYLLPGTIGGALAGNARYDMKNVSDVFLSAMAVHPEHGGRTFAAGDIAFDYKFTSVVEAGWVFCEVSLAWRDGDPSHIREAMDTIEKNRRETHHFDFPSCGCVFKNDYSRTIQAGRLIDSLGLKGLAVGGAQVAGFHANFIVNTGNATARDVLTLIEKIEAIVFERTGIRLEREVRLLGMFTS